jgi:hypothetical protein
MAAIAAADRTITGSTVPRTALGEGGSRNREPPGRRGEIVEFWETEAWRDRGLIEGRETPLVT